MKTWMIFAILFVAALGNSFGQNDWKDSLRIASEMTATDYDYLKGIIQEDVVNWPDQVQDKIRELGFHLKTMLMIGKDTAVYIPIETKQGIVELDIVAEFQRRIYGGFAGNHVHVESWDLEIELSTVHFLLSRRDGLKNPVLGEECEGALGFFRLFAQLFAAKKLKEGEKMTV